MIILMCHMLKKRIFPVFAMALLFVAFTVPASAQVTAYKQAIAEAAVEDQDIAAYYREMQYTPLWTGNTPKDKARRVALFETLATVHNHGLPHGRYGAEQLKQKIAAARSPRARGFVEVEISKVFLRLAKDMETGVLIPGNVVDDIKRKVFYRNRTAYLSDLSHSNPRTYFRELSPRSNEYTRLLKQKISLEQQMAKGGWGPVVPSAKFELGQSGSDVVHLRDRLIFMGYLGRSTGDTYDKRMQRSVRSFQQDHGLEEDGVAGKGTLTEINVSAEDRLKSVIVALERERWFNRKKGARHILVNLTDFSARIFDNDSLTFETRAVVGKNVSDQRSPEFSDEMEHMVINPSWYVPRSITTKEYLPQLRANPSAVGHLQVLDSRGRVVNRTNVDFSQYTARSFPFSLKQPPSNSNALGLVKFMFPNKYNIYLHDTPAKSLFQRNRRAFSHGCIRLQQPFDFAYEILSKQEADPKAYFQRRLKSGNEATVVLKEKVPVHIIYRTAFTRAKGRMQYRRDVYGRDAKIWNALSDKGVMLSNVQS